MKIFGWINEEIQGKAGNARIRIGVPFDELNNHGHEATYDMVPGWAFRDNEVIVGCRIAKPEASMPWVRTCGAMDGPFMVFETDDDNLGLSPYNSARRFWSKPEIRANYLANMRVSHRIVTSTNYLANLIQDQTGHPDVVVARNTVPGWMLDIGKIQNQNLIIGWAGGSSHQGDWEWARDGIRKALVRLPDWKFRIIGYDYRKGLRLPEDRMEYVPWFLSVDDYWRSDALGVDIGLAPIMPSEFNRSKSEIKLIEYAARGVPVIATRYGIYEKFVKHGETGLLVSNKKEWTAAILELATDHDLRESMGAAARLQARNHTIEARWREYEEAYTP